MQSYRKGKSLKDTLVRAELVPHRFSNRLQMAGVGQARQLFCTTLGKHFSNL